MGREKKTLKKKQPGGRHGRKGQDDNTGTMGFEEGVSVDAPPTNPICQECLERGFGTGGGCDHPRTVMNLINKITGIMVQMGIIKDGEMATCGNGKKRPRTCFASCKCLPESRRRALVNSATYQRQVKNTPPVEKPVCVIMAEDGRKKQRDPQTVDERALESTINGGGYAQG